MRYKEYNRIHVIAFNDAFDLFFLIILLISLKGSASNYAICKDS